VSGLPDYLYGGIFKTDSNRKLVVGLDLRWFGEAADGDGVFTLVAPTDVFEVDVALPNYPNNPTVATTPYASGWDGQTLTKAGAGTLILSETNLYTGKTDLNGGTLRLSATDAVAASSDVTLAAGTTLDTATAKLNQNINNLSGAAGSFVTLDANTMTLHSTAAGNTYAGQISGAGALALAEGLQILTGANTYSSGTAIAVGSTLQLGSGGASGSITGNIEDDGTLVFNRDTSSNLTLNGVISGLGQVRQVGSGTTILSNNANSYSGGSTISDGVLRLTAGGAAGSGAVTINTTPLVTTLGLELAFAANGTFANQLIGSGVTTVANVSIIGPNNALIPVTATITGNNTAYAGYWNILGSAASSGDGASLTGTSSRYNFGTGTINVAAAAGPDGLPGTLTINAGNDFAFNNQLTGGGIINVNGSGPADTLDPVTGELTINATSKFWFDNLVATDAFTGTVVLANTLFELHDDDPFLNGTDPILCYCHGNATALTNATLVVGQGSRVVVSLDDGQPEIVHEWNIGGLVFDGGTVSFNDDLLSHPTTPGIVVAGTLDFRNGGTVQVILPAEFTDNPTAPDANAPLMEQDAETGDSLSKLVGMAAGQHAVGSAQSLNLVDQDGKPFDDGVIVHFFQQDYNVADLTYNFGLTSGEDNDGLYVTYGLTQVNLLGTLNADGWHNDPDPLPDGNHALVLSPGVHAATDPLAANMAARIVGEGDLVLDADEANSTVDTVSLSNTANNYTGKTLVVSGTTLRLGKPGTSGPALTLVPSPSPNDAPPATGLLGRTSDLRVAAGATVDMNDYTQTVGALHTQAGATVLIHSGPTPGFPLSPGDPLSILTIDGVRRAADNTVGSAIDTDTLAGTGWLVITDTSPTVGPDAVAPADRNVVYVHGDQTRYEGRIFIQGGSTLVLDTPSAFDHIGSAIVLNSDDNKLVFGSAAAADPTWTANSGSAAVRIISDTTGANYGGHVVIQDGITVTLTGRNSSGGTVQLLGNYFGGQFDIEADSTLIVNRAMNLGIHTGQGKTGDIALGQFSEGAKAINIDATGKFIVDANLGDTQADLVDADNNLIDLGNWTLLPELIGEGEFHKQGTGTLTIARANNNLSGDTFVEGGVLRLADAGGVGTGDVTISTAAGDTAQGLSFHLITAQDFYNILLGDGVTTVETGTATVTFHDNGADYTGQWQINGNAVLKTLETDSQSGLGTGRVDIAAPTDAAIPATGGRLTILVNTDYEFNNELTGGGVLAADGGATVPIAAGSAINVGVHAFDFAGDALTSGFAGTLYLTNNTFLLDGDNTLALQNATLKSGLGNLTTVGPRPPVQVALPSQQIGGLAFDGGTLNFGSLGPGQIQADNHILVSGTLDAGGTGYIQINQGLSFAIAAQASWDVDLPDDIPDTLYLVEQDDGRGMISLASITDTGTVVGTGGGLELIDQDGVDITASTQRTISITQTDATSPTPLAQLEVAKGIYGLRLDTVSATNAAADNLTPDGLYLAYELNEVQLIGKMGDHNGGALRLTVRAGATGINADLSARITDYYDAVLDEFVHGDLAIQAGVGQVISLSNATNSYTGMTLVRNGTLRLDDNHVLGYTSNLIVGPNGAMTTAGLGGPFSQSVGALDTVGGGRLTLAHGSTLTITGTQRNDVDNSDGAGGISNLGGGIDDDTLAGDGALVIEPGIVYVNGEQQDYNGAITLRGGATLVLNTAGAFNTAGTSITLTNATDTLIFGDAGDYDPSWGANADVYDDGLGYHPDWSGVTSGLAAVQLSGVGKAQVNDGISVELTADNSDFAGQFVINANGADADSRLIVSAAKNLGAATQINNAGVFEVNTTTDWTLTTPMTGAGDFIKDGTGTLTIRRDNTAAGLLADGIVAAGMSGPTTIQGGLLELTNARGLGTGLVTVVTGTGAANADKGLNLNLDTADSFANQLAGTGWTTVQADSALVTITGNNGIVANGGSNYQGQWQIDGDAAVTAASTDSNRNLGSGQVNIGADGTLTANTNGAFNFSNALAGTGTLFADQNSACAWDTPVCNAFTFGTNAGNAFAGTVSLTNNYFALTDTLANPNASALLHATLVIGEGNYTTVGAVPPAGNPFVVNTIGGLNFDGGTLSFVNNADLLNAYDTPALIVTDLLDLNGSGTVQVNLPAAFTNHLPPPLTSNMPLLEQDAEVPLSKLIEATGAVVSGTGDNLKLIDQSGNVLYDPNDPFDVLDPDNPYVQIIPILQGGNPFNVANGLYGLRLSPSDQNDGLYVTYGLTTVDLLGNIQGAGNATNGWSNTPDAGTGNHALTLTPGVKALTDAFAADLSAKVIGVGDLHIDADPNGNGIVWNGTNSVANPGKGWVSLSNVANTYTGQTLVSTGLLVLGAPNTAPDTIDGTETLLGFTSNLRVAAGAQVNMNGYSQAVGALNTEAGARVTITAGSTLTITDQQRLTDPTLPFDPVTNPVATQLGGGIDKNTLAGTGTLVIDPSLVYVNGNQAQVGLIGDPLTEFLGTVQVIGGTNAQHSELHLNTATAFNGAAGILLQGQNDYLIFGSTTDYDATWDELNDGAASVALTGAGTVQVNDGIIVALTGDNSGFTGKMQVNAHAANDDPASKLIVSAARNLGDASLVDNAGIFEANAASIVESWTLSTQLAGVGDFIVNGNGLPLANENNTGTVTLTATDSTQGSVTVVAGELVLAQTGVFTVDDGAGGGDYTTQTGAVTTLSEDSTLSVGGVFTQAKGATPADGATLNVTIGQNNTPMITAGSAQIAGTLNVDGYTLAASYATATSLDNAVTLIHTTDGITGAGGVLNAGDFERVTGVDETSTLPDYVAIMHGIVNKGAAGVDYDLNLGLRWFAGTEEGYGTFTLTGNNAFNVDVVLDDQAASIYNGGWNGKDLTKAGTGTLTLSKVNTYTGKTDINDGTLQLSAANAIAASRAVTLQASAQAGVTTTLDLTTGVNQTLNNLNGDANTEIKLLNNTLTLNNEAFVLDALGEHYIANGVATSNTYNGVISGAGGKLAVASGTQTLTGVNTYTGGTQIAQPATLIVTQSAALGAVAGGVANNGTLELDFAAPGNLAHSLSGAGELVQAGAAATLTGAGSQQGGVSVNAGKSLTLNGTGVFKVQAGAAGAGSGNFVNNGTTTLAGNAQVQILGAGAYTQSATGTLNVTIGGGNPPANTPMITAASATLGGTLDVSNFTVGSGFVTASSLSSPVTLIHTTGGITSWDGVLNAGDFEHVTGTDGSNLPDYITITHGIVNKGVAGVDYDINLNLRWYAGATEGYGTFTVNQNDAPNPAAFEVDVALQDVGASSYGNGLWSQNGHSALTKAGTGMLMLTSAGNDYTGGTFITGGTLALAGVGTIADSAGVSLTADAAGNPLSTFDISGVTPATVARIQSLDGAADTQVTLGNNTLEITNAGNTFNDDGSAFGNDYAGDITGAGSLSVTGGTQILSNANSYTGGTAIGVNGTLQLGNGGTSGSVVGNIHDDGLLVFKRSDVVTFVDVIEGNGAVQVQPGNGNTGTVIFTNTNTYTGGTTIEAFATLQLGADESTAQDPQILGSGSTGGATGSITGDIEVNGTLVFNRKQGGAAAPLTLGQLLGVLNTPVMTVNGDITGTGLIELTGTGTIGFAGDNSGYAGDIDVKLGTLQVTNPVSGSSFDSLGTGAITIEYDPLLANPDPQFTQVVNSVGFASDVIFAQLFNNTGRVNIVSDDDFMFENELLGNGLLRVQKVNPDLLNPANNPTFSFGANVGTGFTGSVLLMGENFELSGDNTTALTNATLVMQAGTVVTVSSDNPNHDNVAAQHIGGLTFSGGTLVFLDDILSQADPLNSPGIVLSGNLGIQQGGTVQITLPDNLDVNPGGNGGNVLEEDDGLLLAKLISTAPGQTFGDGSNISLMDENGNYLYKASGNDDGQGVINTTRVQIDYNDFHAADGIYGFNLTGSEDKDGLYVQYSLSELDLIGKFQCLDFTTASCSNNPPAGQETALTLRPEAGASGRATELSAKVADWSDPNDPNHVINGDLVVDAGEGNTVSLTNVGNTYSGQTLVLSGTLLLGSGGSAPGTFLGRTSNLRVAAGATVDLGNYSQTVGALNTTTDAIHGAATVHIDGSLTIDGNRRNLTDNNDGNGGLTLGGGIDVGTLVGTGGGQGGNAQGGLFITNNSTVYVHGDQAGFEGRVTVQNGSTLIVDSASAFENIGSAVVVGGTGPDAPISNDRLVFGPTDAYDAAWGANAPVGEASWRIIGSGHVVLQDGADVTFTGWNSAGGTVLGNSLSFTGIFDIEQGATMTVNHARNLGDSVNLGVANPTTGARLIENNGTFIVDNGEDDEIAVDNPADWTLDSAMNGNGLFIKRGPSTLTISRDNTAAGLAADGITASDGTVAAGMTGDTQVEEGVLKLATQAAVEGGLGTGGTVTIEADATLELAAESTYTHATAGDGTVLVSGDGVQIAGTNNDGFSGTWDVTGTALIGSAGTPSNETASRANLGADGTVNIDLNGAFSIHAANAYVFDNALTGDGTLLADNSASAFTTNVVTGDVTFTPSAAFNFGDAATVGDQFAGTVVLTHNTFALMDDGVHDNAAALANATLVVGAGNVTTVGKAPVAPQTTFDAPTIGGLTIDGGLLSFVNDPTLLSYPNKPALLITGTLDIDHVGVVQVNVPNGFENPPPPLSTAKPLLEQDDGTLLSQLIAVDTAGGGQVIGVGTYLTLVDQNGNVVSDKQVFDIVQSTFKVAEGTYNFGLIAASSTGNGPNDGLYISYGLDEINLIGTFVCAANNTGSCSNTPAPLTGNHALVFSPGPDAAVAADYDMKARIVGSGDLVITGSNNSTITLANGGNTYTGQTLVTTGTLKLGINADPNATGAEQFLGATSRLRVSSVASVDLNGYSQKVGSLDTVAGARVTISPNSTLTIASSQRNALDNPVAGLGGGIDTNTLFGAGHLVIDPSTVYVNGDQSNYLGDVTVTGGSTLVLNSASAYNSAAFIQLATTTDTLVFGSAAAYDPTWTAIPTSATSTAVAIRGTGGVTVRDNANVIFTGTNKTYAGNTNVLAGSTLQAAVNNALSPNSAINVATATSTLNLNGHNQTLAGLTNSGTVNFGTGTAPGTTLTVNGNYLGNNGILLMNTQLGDDLSPTDRMIVTGTVSGSTTISLTNANGLGAATTDGILLVQVGQLNLNPDAFTLSGLGDPGAGTDLTGAYIDAGAYRYRLYEGDRAGNGANWYLRTDGGSDDGEIRPDVPLLDMLGILVRQNDLDLVGDLHKRMGDELIPLEDGFHYSGRPWARLLASKTDQTSHASPGTPTANGHAWGAQLGIDLFQVQNSDGRTHVGLYGGLLRSRADVSDITSQTQEQRNVGQLNPETRAFGAYWTHKNQRGFYTDLIVQQSWYNGHLTVADSQQQHRLGGSGTLVSLESGYALDLDNDWQLEPQAQIIRQGSRLDGMTLPNATVSFDTASQWTGRLGLRLSKTAHLPDGGTMKPYVRANLWHGFNATQTTTFNFATTSTAIETPLGYTTGEAAGGVTWAMTDKVSLYGELGYRFTADKNAPQTKKGTAGTIGLKWDW
jgi:autotransporter-associated beta strand protein